MMHRRELIGAAIAAGGASLFSPEAVRSAHQPAPPSAIIDTNISLFQWPFRRLPLDELKALVRKLRALGITEAWAGSFEGLLHRDIAGVNQRLVQACERHPEWLPFG